MLVSLPPYRPSSGQWICPATSMAVRGWIGLTEVLTGPYQATAAFTCVLCAAYSQVPRGRRGRTP